MDRRSRLDELKEWQARARAFTGWDHSQLSIRELDGGLPWDYESLARDRATRATCIVDLSTGGGERFARIAQSVAARCIATEEWDVNARVAAANLAPLGIPVVLCECHVPRIPLASGRFDLVLSRHSAIDIADVDRLLEPGGVLLTQQVTPDTWPEIRLAFPRMTVFEDHATTYPGALRRLGYAVTITRHESPVAYGSLGDLVFMLTTAPWQIPDFDVERDLDALLALERDCLRAEGLVVTEGHYLLEAVKPAH